MSNATIESMRDRLQTTTASRRTALRGLGAGLLVAGAAGRMAAAAQPATPEPIGNFPGETFVGETSNPDVLIAVVLAAMDGGVREARAYLCDWAGTSEWLLGTATGETLELSNEAGAELRGEVTASGVSGTATLPDGTALTFAAGPATGTGGLYTITVSADHMVSGPSTAGGRLAGVAAERVVTSPDGEGYLVVAILTPAEGEPEPLLSLLDGMVEGSGRLIVLNEAAKARGRVRSVRRVEQDDRDGAVHWREVRDAELAEQ